MPKRTSSRRSGKATSGKKSTRGKFRYQRRTAQQMEKRANQQGFDRTSLFKDGVKVYTAKDGLNKVRILPPTWDGAEHFGLDIYVYYNLGPNKDAFLSPSDMTGSPDPVAEEKAKAEAEDDTEYAKSLRARKRVVYYVIDRKAPEDGVQVYNAPWSLDKEISAQAIDEESGEVIPVDDPEEGCDVIFKKSGKGLNTDYSGIKIARTPTPISKNPKKQAAILQEIADTPLPDTLNHVDYETLEALFAGKKAKGKGKDRDDDEDEDEDEEIEFDDLRVGQSVVITTKDGDEVTGEVTVTKSKYVKIEDEDDEVVKVSKRDVESIVGLEDEDEEDEDDDDGEDEDSDDEEDEEDDEDDEDEDDEDERDDDEEDEDDEDDDEEDDEDDEERSLKKAARKKSGKTKRTKVRAKSGKTTKSKRRR